MSIKKSVVAGLMSTNKVPYEEINDLNRKHVKTN
jgi:hypothetical protein